MLPTLPTKTRKSLLFSDDIVGTLRPPTLLKGRGGEQDLPKIESLGWIRNFLLERGDKPEKGGLM